MAELRDVLRYNVATLSDSIWRLKSECRIEPKHPRWGEYKRLKRDVSLWLAAVRLQKAGETAYPGVLIKCGADHGCDYRDAEKRLARLKKRIRKDPGAFASVAEWMEAAHA